MRRKRGGQRIRKNKDPEIQAEINKGNIVDVLYDSSR
jgi:hypothetical protein